MGLAAYATTTAPARSAAASPAEQPSAVPPVPQVPTGPVEQMLSRAAGLLGTDTIESARSAVTHAVAAERALQRSLQAHASGDRRIADSALADARAAVEQMSAARVNFQTDVTRRLTQGGLTDAQKNDLRGAAASVRRRTELAGWALGAIESADAARASLREAKQAYGRNDRLAGLTHLDTALGAVDHMSSRAEFLRFAVKSRAVDRHIADDQLRVLESISAGVQRRTAPLYPAVVAAGEQRLGTSSAQASFDRLAPTFREAATAARRFLTAFASGNEAVAQRENLLVEEKLLATQALKHLVWEQGRRDGKITPKDCGDSCLEWVTSDDLNALYAAMPRIGATEIRTIQLIDTWIVSAAGTQQVQGQAKAKLAEARRALAAGNRDEAVAALAAAYQGLYASAAGLNLGAHTDPDYYSLHRRGQPNPVTSMNRKLRASYTQQLREFGQLRAQARPADTRVPKAASLPREPWVLYPDGDASKPPFVFPPAPASTRGGR